eukprot:7414232-Karenia_brevis.AAC.1
MPTHKQIEEAKEIFHKHFDTNFFGVDVSHMATSDIWASWSSDVCQSLSSGLQELAKDVECSLPDAKDLQSHGM